MSAPELAGLRGRPGAGARPCVQRYTLPLAAVLGALLGFTLPNNPRLEDATNRSLPSALDPRIAVIAIDDVTLRDYGTLGNWSRDLYVQAFSTLRQAGARASGLDVVLGDAGAGGDARPLCPDAGGRGGHGRAGAAASHGADLRRPGAGRDGRGADRPGPDAEPGRARGVMARWPWVRGTAGAGAAAPAADDLRAGAEAAAAGLPALILAAERLANAALPGAHGLRRAGPGDEFWQYRAAVAGDDARAIDWRRSARGDADFIRDRERVSPQSAALWVARGPGMDWGGAPDRPTKREAAVLIALALGVLLLRGGERVALLGDTPRSGRSHLPRLAEGMVGRAGGAARGTRTPVAAARQAAPDERAEAGSRPPGGSGRPAAPTGAEDLSAPRAAADDPAAGTGRHPSAIMPAPDPAAIHPGQRLILLGDFLGDPAPLLAFLARAAAADTSGALMQVLDPVEETFPFEGVLRFRDPSAGPAHETRDAAGLRRAYLDRLAARRQQLTDAAAAAGWRFGTHTTARPPAEALLWLAAAVGR